jgi:hypothetical protein
MSGRRVIVMVAVRSPSLTDAVFAPGANCVVG